MSSLARVIFYSRSENFLRIKHVFPTVKTQRGTGVKFELLCLGVEVGKVAGAGCIVGTEGRGGWNIVDFCTGDCKWGEFWEGGGPMCTCMEFLMIENNGRDVVRPLFGFWCMPVLERVMVDCCIALGTYWWGIKDRGCEPIISFSTGKVGCVGQFWAVIVVLMELFEDDTELLRNRLVN